jgi:hypothetical protein
MSGDLKKRLDVIRRQLADRKSVGVEARAEGEQAKRDYQQALVDAEGPACRFSMNRITPRFHELQKEFPRAVGEEISKRAVIESAPGVEGWLLQFRDDRLYLLAAYDDANVTLIARTECGDRTVYGADGVFPVQGFDETENGEPAKWLQTHSSNAAAQLMRETAHGDAYRGDVIRVNLPKQ